MPWNLTWSPRGVHIRYHGHVDTGEVLASTEAVHGDARFDDLRYRINDFLGVTSFDRAGAPHEVEELAAITYAASHSGIRRRREGLVAHVATAPEVRTLIEHFMGHDETHYGQALLPSLEEARHWVAQNLAYTLRNARSASGLRTRVSASPPTGPATSRRGAGS